MKGTMKRSILYALLRAMALAVSAILAFACVETLDVETGERPIVLRCILTESDTQELDLHYVMKQGETEPVPVVDARAWILSGKDTVARFSKISDGRWSASFRPDFGGKYRLEVESGDQRLAAETEFLDDISLVSRGARFVDYFPVILVSYAVANGTESAKGLMEMRKVSQDSVYWGLTDSIPDYYDKDCSFLIKCKNNRQERPGECFPLIWTSHPDVVPFRISDVVFSHGKEMELLNSRNNKEGVSLIHAYFVPFDRCFEDSPYYTDFVLIRQKASFSNGLGKSFRRYGLFSDGSFLVRVGFPGFEPFGAMASLPLKVTFLSESYASYLCSSFRKNENKGDLVSNLYDYTNLTSNVLGGCGVFGAILERTVPEIEMSIDN